MNCCSVAAQPWEVQNVAVITKPHNRIWENVEITAKNVY